MENVNLIDTFSEFRELKSIDRATMMSVLEDVFRNLIVKEYGSHDNYDVIINVDKGDFEIWRNREVVEDADLEGMNEAQLTKLQASLVPANDFSANAGMSTNSNHGEAPAIDFSH